MDKQKGFINIPGWFFWLAPIAVVLIVVNTVQLAYWLYQHISWSWQ